MSDPLYLVITLDVEEEGLFSENYPRTGSQVTNVVELRRLEFIPREFGFPLTLLVTYPVVRNQAAQEVLNSWQQKHQAEIGVHLHPWNTPPYIDSPDPEPIPTVKLPQALLEAKLGYLVNCISETFQKSPRSFRMGRFDWTPGLLALLPSFGLGVDSSILTLSFKGGGRQNFLAPTDPFWLEVSALPRAKLLEAPVTMVPVWEGTARALHRIAALLPRTTGEALLSRYRFVGTVGIHPSWYPSLSMRLAAYLHRRRGGRILNLFLHSSELLPGGNPQFPTLVTVERLVAKFRNFLAWLVKWGPVKGVTSSGLHDLMASRSAEARVSGSEHSDS